MINDTTHVAKHTATVTLVYQNASVAAHMIAFTNSVPCNLSYCHVSNLAVEQADEMQRRNLCSDSSLINMSEMSH